MCNIESGVKPHSRNIKMEEKTYCRNSSKVQKKNGENSKN